jgi:hypothetical protein
MNKGWILLGGLIVLIAIDWRLILDAFTFLLYLPIIALVWTAEKAAKIYWRINDFLTNYNKK